MRLKEEERTGIPDSRQSDAMQWPRLRPGRIWGPLLAAIAVVSLFVDFSLFRGTPGRVLGVVITVVVLWTVPFLAQVMVVTVRRARTYSALERDLLATRSLLAEHLRLYAGFVSALLPGADAVVLEVRGVAVATSEATLIVETQGGSLLRRPPQLGQGDPVFVVDDNTAVILGRFQVVRRSERREQRYFARPDLILEPLWWDRMIRESHGQFPYGPEMIAIAVRRRT